jgi:hypothetical protein
MPKTTKVTASKQTEENLYGETSPHRLTPKLIKAIKVVDPTREWVRENPIKGKVIRLDQHKATSRTAIKADLKKIKADLPTTPSWIRVIGVDRNKGTMAHREVKKADLNRKWGVRHRCNKSIRAAKKVGRKVKIVLPKARANLQWKARKIRDHTRWMPG